MNSRLFLRCGLHGSCSETLPCVSSKIRRTQRTHAYFVLRCPTVPQVFQVLVELDSTRHCCWHRHFQLSTSIFHHTLEFFIIRFNIENSTYPSGIIEFWFLDGPFLLFFAFRCIRHMLPHIWPHIVGS